MSHRYRVAYTPKAVKQIGKLDKAQVRRIQRFFEQTLDLQRPHSRGRETCRP